VGPLILAMVLLLLVMLEVFGWLPGPGYGATAAGGVVSEHREAGPSELP
jgi:hypothetical protein